MPKKAQTQWISETSRRDYQTVTVFYTKLWPPTNYYSRRCPKKFNKMRDQTVSMFKRKWQPIEAWESMNPHSQLIALPKDQHSFSNCVVWYHCHESLQVTFPVCVSPQTSTVSLGDTTPEQQIGSTLLHEYGNRDTCIYVWWPVSVVFGVWV